MTFWLCELKSYRFTISGVVQGVGFRPFLYRLADKYRLKGRVYNAGPGVVVEVQGNPDLIRRFIWEVIHHPPLQAVIHEVGRELVAVSTAYQDFVIDESHRGGTSLISSGADVGICDDCLEEMYLPDNRRYLYPFINCTNCGPRYTIIQGLPYDRANTSMKQFPMCPACLAEYHNPLDRRFHAEPIACLDCGPSLILYKVDPAGFLKRQDVTDVLGLIGDALKNGEIVVFKGVGGFHFVGDARVDKTVLKIRQLKGRDEKPLAIMVRDLEAAKRFCKVTDNDIRNLTSNNRPIVIMERREDHSHHLSSLIAPGQVRLGIMLPYTPLHNLLFDQIQAPLVITSWNRVSMPMVTDESQQSPTILKGVSWVLSNNRRIVSRSDDSVLISSPHQIIIRRARGFAPIPLRVPKTACSTLGVGGDQKNTLCFLNNGIAVITPYLGSVDNEETFTEWQRSFSQFRTLFNTPVDAVGCDLHPGYLTRQFVLELGLPLVGVQHHHAHIASCMAENMLTGSVLGIALDGTGYGLDGTVWGGEFLQVDYAGYQRLGFLKPVALPGGDLVVREPWRMALSYLYSVYGCNLPDFPGAGYWERKDSNLIFRLLAQNYYTLTSSAGRLFDAVASLLSLAHVVTYEGQAAIALETLANCYAEEPDIYDYDLIETEEAIQLNLEPCIRGIVTDLVGGSSKAEIAKAFHLTLVHGINALCTKIRQRTGLGRIALSGGVFQNTFLLGRLLRILQTNGFDVFMHKNLPPNDGGISLGQSMVAAHMCNDMDF